MIFLTVTDCVVDSKQGPFRSTPAKHYQPKTPTRAAASGLSTESQMGHKYRTRVVNQRRFESLKLVLQN